MTNVYNTTSEAYSAVVTRLVDSPEYVVAPRGQVCREVTNLTFTVSNPRPGPISTLSATRDRVMTRYLAVEESLYLSGERRALVWAETASKFWADLGDRDGLITSNYGWLIFHNRSLPDSKTPWEWAMTSLKRDRDSRQAYIRIALPEHQWEGNPDQTCTLHLMLAIRHGRLHGTTVMRSNDVIKGLPYDMPWFCRVLNMAATELGVPTGTYTHIAHSMHLYERDLNTALELLGRA